MFPHLSVMSYENLRYLFWPQEVTNSFISVTDKDKWINVERLHWLHLFAVPIAKSMPDGFPPLTLTIMRTPCALTALDPDQEKLCQSLDALFKTFWVDRQPTHQPGVMQQVLRQVLGEETV
jgi:2-hydroxychromene-2-carboxylate isomerase